LNHADTIDTSAELVRDVDEAGGTAVPANASVSISERLQQSIEVLGGIGSLTEFKFVAIGDCIQRAVAILGHLTVTFEGLLAEMQSEAVLQAKQDIALAAAEAGRLADAAGTEAAGLGRLEQVTRAIHIRITAMRQIARDVDMLAINARLIAAGMGESGLDFLGFAAEIRRSTKLAQARLEQIGSELMNAERQLAAARTGVMAYAERHGETLRTIPQRLAAAGATITAHDHLAADAATAVAARTADVQRRVASMIVELQLGDVTRQRIEHMMAVAGTLRSLTSAASSSHSEWRMLSAGEVASLLQTGCNLVTAQLRDTAGELDNEALRVADGLGRLAADARDINRLAEHAFGAVDQDRRGFMVELEADLRNTAAVFGGLRAARGETEHRVADVMAIMHRLTGSIDTLRGLEVDIRIMGLNTTLKCGRLGTLGRPLSVIAQALRDYGSRTESHADAALNDLTLLAELAGSFNTGREELHGAVSGKLSQTLLGAVDLLGHTGQTLSSVLAGLDDDSGAAANLLQEATLDFSVRRDVGEVLHGTAEVLGEIAAEQADQSMTNAAVMERMLARFASVYTMAREREVHARCGGPAVQQSTAAAEPDLADVLF
jgi:hypothetical protein